MDNVFVTSTTAAPTSRLCGLYEGIALTGAARLRRRHGPTDRHLPAADAGDVRLEDDVVEEVATRSFTRSRTLRIDDNAYTIPVG